MVKKSKVRCFMTKTGQRVCNNSKGAKKNFKKTKIKRGPSKFKLRIKRKKRKIVVSKKKRKIVVRKKKKKKN
jgi:hypothetical protein